MLGSLAGGGHRSEDDLKDCNSEVKCAGTVVPWLLGWGGDEGCRDDWVGMGLAADGEMVREKAECRVLRDRKGALVRGTYSWRV